MTELSDNQILTIFREVASGRGKHGDFLVNFARAFCFADPENSRILRLPARVLAQKYNLQSYATPLFPDQR